MAERKTLLPFDVVSLLLLFPLALVSTAHTSSLPLKRFRTCKHATNVFDVGKMNAGKVYVDEQNRVEGFVTIILSLRAGGMSMNFDKVDRKDIFRRRLVQGFIVTAIALPLAAEAYSRGAYGFSPQRSSDLYQPEKGWDPVEHATIVFHGASGQDAYTDELESAIKKNRRHDGRSYDLIVDWSEDSKNILQASFNGQRLGRRVASQLLAKASSLRSLHAIGISVGAFAADSCVTELKQQLLRPENKGREVFAQVTLLDPFTQRGVLDPGYGERNFGYTADFAEQYLNTDDPVPNTNKPLPGCACIDVTKTRPTNIFGHDWPLAYYSRSGRVGVVAEGERRRRGDVSLVH